MRNSSMTLMAGAFVPERQIPSEQRDRLSPGEREGGKCAEGAVTASLSRMTQMSWPEPPNLQEPLNVPACPHTTKDPSSSLPPTSLSWSIWRGSGQEGALRQPSLMSAPDWHHLITLSQQTGEGLGLTLAPRAEKQRREARDTQGHTAEGRSPPGQPSPCS